MVELSEYIKGDRHSRWVVGLAVASLIVTLPHSLEDFVSGIPARFGLSVLVAGVILGFGYAVHVVGILRAAQGSPIGYAINMLIGLIWFLGAVFDHLPEVVGTGPYRAGLPSKALVVGIMVISAALAIVSARALWSGRAKQRAV